MSSEIKEFLTQAFDMYPEDTDVLSLLCKLGQKKTFPKGTVFIKEGEEADFFYLIIKGNVNINIQMAEKKRSIYRAGSGEPVGWSSLVEPRLYKGDAVASTELLVIAFNAEALMVQMKRFPRLGYLVMYRISQFLSQRLLHSIFEAMAKDSSESAGLSNHGHD